MKRLFLHLSGTMPILAVLMGAVCFAQESEPNAEDSNKLARVHSHVIDREEMETFLNGFMMQDSLRRKLGSMPEVQRQQVLAQGRRRALEQLIERYLLLEAAHEELESNEKFRDVIDKVVDRRFGQLRETMGSLISVVRKLHDRGLSVEEWKEFMRQLVWIQNYVWKQTRIDRRVRPNEVRRYYRCNRESFRRPQRIVYRAILVDPAGCQTKEEEKEKANEILDKLQDGGDFAKLAEKYSLDRDETEGGLREVKAPKSDPDWMPPLCEGLQVGEISAVQETAAGFCIAKLEKVIPTHIPAFETLQNEIREKLAKQKRKETREEILKDLIEKGNVKLFPAGRTILGDSAKRF
ncbi:MAG: peptidylprolyl isomerase [Planctomycetes bacterium]|nr:peptidylprolyl isomerase [Planctomycetota bacterium]